VSFVVICYSSHRCGLPASNVSSKWLRNKTAESLAAPPFKKAPELNRTLFQ